MIQQYIKLLRISHWTKNLFLFLPLFFSGQILTNYIGILEVAIGFMAFSAMASSIYIINDIKDREADRLHPDKKHRPFASGTISVKTGVFIAGILILSSFIGSMFLEPNFAAVLAFYFIMNVMYSLGLKNIAILDTTIIALGFLLRVIGGGIIAQVYVSHWIVIMTFLLALFLGFAKRRDDVLLYLESGQKARKSIAGYNLEFINASMVIMAGVVIVSYLMYTLSEDVIQRFGTNYLYVTSLFVILGIIRYLQITFVMNKSGNPTKVLLKDLFIQLVITGWILTFFVIIYINKKNINLG